MSRGKKFRVWDKVEKEMMSPVKWEEDYVGCGHKKIGLYIYRSQKDPRQHSSLDWVLRHPESFDVMQFTGKLDNENIEICSGDIASLCTNLGDINAVCEYWDGLAQFVWVHGQDVYNLNEVEAKIIGTIHDKELLNDNS